MKVYITGIGGFIGFHAANALHALGIPVAGADNFNPYYDPSLKRRRAEILQNQGIEIKELDICEPGLEFHMDAFQPTHLLHLAAQAGVRYSLQNPAAYVKSNIEGFLQILEYVRKRPEISLVYASSSSVYGLNSKLPYSVSDRTDEQASFYGVTKKNNELMAANYAHVFGIKSLGLRFFTVYGPWGRPDMALYKFTSAILEGRPIDLYNHGNMQRDFTYIDDIVAGIIASLNYKGKKTLFNLGNNTPMPLQYFLEVIEQSLGKKGVKNLLPMQPGEVLATYADIEESGRELGFHPKTSIEEGIPRFVEWYVKEIAKGGT
jgi:UDP-glucuronate 4-epimerase